jgi:hypothetical protein
MKVSVVIPLYNKAAYIQRALDSIRRQTLADFEVLVIDDGSTDAGPDLVAAAGDPRIRLIRQANAGPGAARNRGIAEATAPYVAFLDGDDEWLPTFLEESLAVLDRPGAQAACVTSGFAYFPSGRSAELMWRRRGLRDGTYRLAPGMSPRFVSHLLAFLTAQGTVIRTEVLRRWGGFYSRGRCLFGEDSYLWLKVLLNETVAVNLRPLWRYHTEASDLSHHLPGPRPVEPMLLDAGDLWEACPVPLEAILQGVLAVRAIKTACMLSYWGQWRKARALLRDTCPWSAFTLPRFWLAQACATPAGAAAGLLLRSLAGAR